MSPLFCSLRMTVENTLTTWVAELLAQRDPSLFLVNVVASAGTGPRKVVVHIDGDQGVPIDVCAEMSRALSHRLDEEELIDDKYTLEVSSPGLSQPLLLRRQYVKNVGRHVKVVLTDDQTVQGELLAVDEEQITVAEKKGGSKKKPILQERRIPFSEIKKTNVLVIFK